MTVFKSLETKKHICCRVTASYARYPHSSVYLFVTCCANGKWRSFCNFLSSQIERTVVFLCQNCAEEVTFYIAFKYCYYFFDIM